MDVSHLDEAEPFVTRVHLGDCIVISPGAPQCCCAPAYSNDDTVLSGG